MVSKSIFHRAGVDIALRASTVALIVPLCIMCPIWISVNYRPHTEAGLAIAASIISAILGLRVLISMRTPQQGIALTTDTPDGPTVQFLNDGPAPTLSGRLLHLAHPRKHMESGILALLDAMLAALYLGALIIFNCRMSHDRWYSYSSPLLTAYIIMFLLPATAIHVFFVSRYAITNSVAITHALVRCARRNNTWCANVHEARSPVVCANCGSHVTPAATEEPRFSAKGPTVYGVEVPRDSDEVTRPETTERDPAPFGQRGDDTALIRDDDSPRVSLIGEQGTTQE